MSDRFTTSAALAAAALLIVLGGAGAGAEPRARRHHAPKPPQLDAPPPIGQPWLYIHCAANGYGWDGPCGLDPAMRRLNGDPVPGSGPNFGPAR
jgi:hypothetical protein